MRELYCPRFMEGKHQGEEVQPQGERGRPKRKGGKKMKPQALRFRGVLKKKCVGGHGMPPNLPSRLNGETPATMRISSRPR